MKLRLEFVGPSLVVLLGLVAIACDGGTKSDPTPPGPTPAPEPVTNDDTNTNPTVTGSVTFSGTATTITTTITITHDGTTGGIAATNLYDVRIYQASGLSPVKEPLPDKLYQLRSELAKSPTGAAIGTLTLTGTADIDAYFYYIAVETLEYKPDLLKTRKGEHLFVRIYSKDAAGNWTPTDPTDLTDAASSIIELK